MYRRLFELCGLVLDLFPFLQEQHVLTWHAYRVDQIKLTMLLIEKYPSTIVEVV